ncbi:hypothetical protein EDD16DRAFT_1544677 [Pisolithus croceorrhizus]|nr:hypothetical protein EDD16DRAFT_1544677 [Pisolithus croceorrhizus]KAI6169671.1 hypothetical protein EDD17DRAFT_23645 [Pisolithus thermaeus]
MHHASRTSLALPLIAVGRPKQTLCRIHGTSSKAIDKRAKTPRLIDITAKTKRFKLDRPALVTSKARRRSPPTGCHPGSSKTSTHVTRIPAQRLLHVDKTSKPSPIIASCAHLHEMVIERVSSVLRRRFGSAYEVVPFGSTVYMRGFDVDRRLFPKQDTGGVQDFSKGDLDLVVLDKDRPLGFTPDIDIKKLPAIYNMWRLAAILSEAGFADVQPVPYASVPIVKFHDPQTQLSLDININNRLGLMNSRLLRSYCDILPGLRTALVAIKLWARSLGLNTPSGGPMTTFSTYALALMTLGWLQSRELAPNLQDGLETKETFWICRSMRAKRQSRVQCDVTFREVTPLDRHPPLSLHDTLADWFHFWGYTFDFEQQALDIKEGPIRNRDALAVLDPKLSEHQVCVIDPFFRLKNVTNNVGSVALQKFRNECRRASNEIRIQKLSMAQIIDGYDLLERLHEPRVDLRRPRRD